MPVPIALINPIAGIDVLRVDPTQKHALGIEVKCVDGTTRKYVRAGAAVALGDFLKVDTAEGSYDFDPTGATNQPCAGVCPVSGVSDNYYFWAIIKGKVAGAKLAAGTAAGAQLGSTATAGTFATKTIGGAFAQAEIQAVQAMAVGVGVLCTVAESGGTGTVVLT